MITLSYGKIRPRLLLGKNCIYRKFWTTFYYILRCTYNFCISYYRYCRPIRISYEKESKEGINREYDRVCSEISRLTPVNVIHNDNPVKVEHQLFITMVDGKVINTLQGNTATSVYYIDYP